LTVYNTLGQEVRTLIEARQDAGRHAIAWDGHDAYGNEVATGMYIYRLMAGDNDTMRKMTFSK
jgi:flagellar hook assembly protein FlgD